MSKQIPRLLSAKADRLEGPPQNKTKLQESPSPMACAIGLSVDGTGPDGPPSKDNRHEGYSLSFSLSHTRCGGN